MTSRPKINDPDTFSPYFGKWPGINNDFLRELFRFHEQYPAKAPRIEAQFNPCSGRSGAFHPVRARIGTANRGPSFRSPVAGQVCCRRFALHAALRPLSRQQPCQSLACSSGVPSRCKAGQRILRRLSCRAHLSKTWSRLAKQSVYGSSCAGLGGIPAKAPRK